MVMIGDSRRRGRAFPLLLIALLWMGAAAHYGHHWLDPDCGAQTGPTSHPCVACSALHGALENAGGETALQAPRIAGSRFIPAADAGRSHAPLRVACSRAPPLA